MRTLYQLPIRKLYRPLKWVWIAFVLVLLTTLVGRWLSRGLIEGKGFALQPEVWEHVRTFGPWVLFVLLVLAGLFFLTWRDERRYQAFGFLKPANELRPKDLGFKVVQPGERPATQDRRPFYESPLIRRTAVPYEDRARHDSQPRYDEEVLIRSLRGGKGFILQGPPLDGKSHMLFEIVRGMDKYEVIRPDPRKVVPDNDTFSLLLEGRRIVLLLDDLTQYVDSELDLQDFGRRLSDHTSSWVVAATCRDGPELRTVEVSSLRKFYEAISLKLRLEPPTLAEKERLAKSIHKEWDSEASGEKYPTLGSITMEEPMEAMILRFRDLLHEHPEQADTLRVLKLLASAGILPFSQHRLQAVLERIFQRHDVHLGDCLRTLREQSFLQDETTLDPVQPEPAYLRNAVTYTEGKAPENDFASLADALKELEDPEGLFYLGVRWLRDYVVYSEEYDYERGAEALEQALETFDRATSSPERWLREADAWYNKGFTLRMLSRPEEALEAFDRATSLREDMSHAWYNKGFALQKLGRPEEALEAFDRATSSPERWLREADAWYNKGFTLRMLSRPEEALEAFDRALSLGQDRNDVWYSKGVVLSNLGRYEEALEALDQALRLAPRDREAWVGKMWLLDKLGRQR